MPVAPKFASTVILYRLQSGTEDSNKCQFEVFLIQRSKKMRFLGGVHAFPGGKLEDEDIQEKNLARCKGFDKNRAHQMILDKNTFHQHRNYSLGFWITGIRELFEEVGILFAYDNKNSLLNLSDPKLQKKFEGYRNKLLEKKMVLSDIMAQEDLYYAVDKLHYFRHFITPELSPIRYDTRFFLAELPPNQTVKPTTTEIISSEWAKPSATLKRYRKKEIILIPPQHSCLSSLRKVADIRDFCKSLY
ncbi:MAG: hypothetical protein HWN66_00090 [Candidatus Helarchaeota archaeon]|nr:hypothetical protein [Candidatus Helarchaeota archaeon]